MDNLCIMRNSNWTNIVLFLVKNKISKFVNILAKYRIGKSGNQCYMILLLFKNFLISILMCEETRLFFKINTSEEKYSKDIPNYSHAF